MSTQNQTLEKSFSTKDVLAMAFGTMIGWGWIMLSGQWAADAGMVGAIIAYVVGALLCVFVGLTYAELTPAIPCTGGGVVFSYRAMGYWPAVIAGLATAFAYLGVAAWEGPAFATAVNYVFPIPSIGFLWNIGGYDIYASWALVAIIASIVITIVNIKGAKQAAIFQTIATAGIICVGILFLSGGIAFGGTENVTPLITSFKGFSAVLLMVPAMFVGFDVIPQSAGEMNVPLKRIPIILILSICAAAIWYMLMIFATCMSAPAAVRMEGTIPVADAMAFAFGNPVWGKICIIGAICGILTSWNGFLYGGARVLFALANAKMLPAFLGKIHPKHHTPVNAIILCGVISTFSCFLGKGALEWFVNASSFGVVIMYAMVVLSFIFLRVREPNMVRPYKVKYAKLVGVLAIGVSCFFAYMYLPMGPSPLAPIEWSFVIGWFIFGLCLAFYAKNRYKHVTEEERSIMLFGAQCAVEYTEKENEFSLKKCKLATENKKL
ncbi:APC family permease [Anaerovorax odorimutans]|uniref:APC family permease n=1 Tax=Anaerovorax odorimutans TaxID=109327 RepID=UPI0004253748|nr:APC family permease [Anaerovorax odorimutans]